jgi:hypothetical protein
MSPISAYEAFVLKYDLSEILADNDFRVTASGDIAMWAGSPQQGDDRCNAMLRLLSRWFANSRVLETLLDLVGVDNFRKHAALSDLDAVAESAANGEDVDRYDALILEDQIGEFGAAACAGAVMVVLNNLLQRYKKDLHAETLSWDTIEPVFGGCSFGQIVVAAANNFRHYDECCRCRCPRVRAPDAFSRSPRSCGPATGRPMRSASMAISSGVRRRPVRPRFANSTELRGLPIMNVCERTLGTMGGVFIS